MVFKRKRGNVFRARLAVKRARVIAKRQPLRRRINRVEKSVKRINSSTETKFTASNTGTTAWAVTNVGSIISPSGKTFWNDVGQGATVSGRVGNEFQMKKLNFTFRLASEYSLDPAFATCVRLMIVLWKKPPPTVALGTSPPLSSVLDVTGTPTLTTGYMYAPYNWVYREYFKVLYDQRHYLTYYKESDGEMYNAYRFMPYKYIRKVLKLNRSVKVNTSDGTAITQNAVQVYAVSDSTKQASCIGFCRMTYQDD